MADSEIPKFYDAESRPPVGGWAYFTNPNDRNTAFRKHSAEDVIAEIERFQKNNGRFVSRKAIEAEVWKYWCSMQPSRCGAPHGTQPESILPRDLDKAFWGPIIWRNLNLVAVRFDYVGRDFFLMTVQHVNNLMTCPTCRDHWNALLAEMSPLGIHDTKAACVWVHAIHERVNALAGKPKYPYSRMVTEFGAPL